MNINPRNCSLTDVGSDKTAEVTMRGNYEPPELLWGQHLISSSSWHQVPACPACLPSSLVVPSSTSTIKDVSSSHFLLFATKSEEKGSFHVFNKALCWISTSQKRAKLWRSVKYDAHLFRIKISQLWGLRSDIAQNVTPSQRNQIRPFHPIPSLSNASWLRYLWVCTPPCAYLFIYSIHKQNKTMPIYADNLWPWAVHVYSQYT